MSRPFGYKHTQETRRKIAIANTGKLSSQWKGDAIKYQAIHAWLKANYGNATLCEALDCPKKSKKYDWALIKGKKYERKRNNFMQMDRSCHKKYDRK